MSNDGRGKTSDEEVLLAINSHYAPAVGTTDIADRVGVSRQAVDQRLWRLVEEGYVETYKAGKSRVWWLSPEGKRRIDDSSG